MWQEEIKVASNLDLLDLWPQALSLTQAWWPLEHIFMRHSTAPNPWGLPGLFPTPARDNSSWISPISMEKEGGPQTLGNIMGVLFNQSHVRRKTFHGEESSASPKPRTLRGGLVQLLPLDK